ncbi:MAG: DUF3106 domain-containing protein [Deltaproteobacteria bacterium]|nr:DUF3106 domain-containing protein [Deltaproteobacteria bacterium]MBW2070483.1 DUF3106 domain-containing protein [Deltaproteobacteria bacterium]
MKFCLPLLSYCLRRRFRIWGFIVAAAVLAAEPAWAGSVQRELAVATGAGEKMIGWQAAEQRGKYHQRFFVARGKGRNPSPGGGYDHRVGGDYNGISPEEKARLEQRYEKWKRMSPRERQMLKRRMERWKKLPPEERDLLRKRYQQWQALSPEERQRIRQKLRHWDELSPQEQERIRRKFRGY